MMKFISISLLIVALSGLSPLPVQAADNSTTYLHFDTYRSMPFVRAFLANPDNKGFILDMLSYRRIERRLFPGSSQKEKRETQRKQFRLNVVSTTTMLPEPTHLEGDREKEGLSVEFGTSVREMMARPKTLMQKVPMSLKERQLLSAHSPASFRDTAIRTAHLLTTTTYKDYCMNPKKINGDILLLKCLQFMLLHDPLALGNIDEYGLAEGEVTTFLSL